MKECAQFEAQVFGAASGGLSPAERSAWDAHARQCVACAKALAREQVLLARTDAGLSAMVAGEPSPEFARRVMDEVTGAAEQRVLAAVDAALAQSVAAAPPPQFAAAVRARIAAEPAPRRAWFSFDGQMYWAGALAAGIALFVFWPGNSQPPAVPLDVRPLERASVVPRPPAPADAAVSGSTEKHRVRITAASERRVPQPVLGAAVEAVALPEVLIPNEELQTVTRFYRYVQEGRINTAQVLQANRMELAARLVELQTPVLVARAMEVKTLDLVDGRRSTSDEK